MGSVEEPTLEYFLETFAKSFMDPLVDGGRGRLFLSFISHEMAAPHLPREVFLEEFLGPLMAVAGEALGRVAPAMDTGALRLCLMSMVGQLLHALMLRTHFMPENQVAVIPGDLTAHLRHIVRFTAGGIRACADGIDTADRRSAEMKGSEA
jgi:hypothetical protein